MYARTINAVSKPDKVDEAIRLYQSLEPLWKEQKGFIGAYLLTNADDSMKTTSVTIWETQADLEATEASGWYAEQVAKFAGVLAAPPTRELHEVTVRI